MKMLNDLHRQTAALICSLNRAAPAGKASVRSQSAGERVRARLRRSDEGSNLVEFALMLPLLVLFLVGIAYLATAFSYYQALTQAVGIAAVQLSESRNTAKDPCSETFTALKNAAPQLNPANITLTITMNDSGPVSGNSGCSGDLTYLQDANPGTVTVTATYLLPFRIPVPSNSGNAGWISIAWTSKSLTASASEPES
jgi:Flp pilus assembly protein TadG